MAIKRVNLRAEAESRILTAAFYGVKDLKPGDSAVLLTIEEPSLVLQSLDLQLRHKLAWTIEREKGGGWRAEIRHRIDVAPSDLVDLLIRDHRRLDGFFAQALQLANRNRLSAALPLITEFAAGIRRHVAAENDLLAARLPLPREPAGADPLSVMLREHDEILGQLALIEGCFESGAPDAGEVSAFLAILSGTLAKHEHREESNLFPIWGAHLAREPQASREELLVRVREMLEG